MSRNRSRKESMQPAMVRLPPEILEKIRAYAERKGLSVSDVLRMIIIENYQRYVKD